jgi:DNA-damage-inducible protein J
MKTHLSARLDSGLKAEVGGILAELGISPSEAITMFYRQILLRRGLPFDVCIPNAETLAAIAELDAGGGRVVRGSGREVLDAILAE